MLLLSCLTALGWSKNISHDGDSNNSVTSKLGFGFWILQSNAKSEKGFYLWEFSPQDGLCNIAFLLYHLIGMQKRIYKTVLIKQCSFFLLIMCVHLREHCACKQFFFSNPFSDFPKKKERERIQRHISQRWNLFFRLCLNRLQIQILDFKIYPYFPVIQQCTFPCQQIMLDCMDTVKFISILNLKILHFLLFVGK